jgi:hypothetical protein
MQNSDGSKRSTYLWRIHEIEVAERASAVPHQKREPLSTTISDVTSSSDVVQATRSGARSEIQRQHTLVRVGQPIAGLRATNHQTPQKK